MTGTGRRYTDRFGHVWTVRLEGDGGGARRVVFTCGTLQLTAPDDDPPAAGLRLTAPRLKELFCDAERTLSFENEEWYVGYRKRLGPGAQLQSGLHTRFRSASGEVRYANQMLQFRHMAEDALCQHLAAARAVRPPARRARKS